jgi:hypothetical protein
MNEGTRLILPLAIKLGIPTIWLGLESLLATSAFLDSFVKHVFHLCAVFFHGIDKRAMSSVFVIHVIFITIQSHEMLHLALEGVIDKHLHCMLIILVNELSHGIAEGVLREDAKGLRSKVFPD